MAQRDSNSEDSFAETRKYWKEAGYDEKIGGDLPMAVSWPRLIVIVTAGCVALWLLINGLFDGGSVSELDQDNERSSIGAMILACTFAGGALLLLCAPQAQKLLQAAFGLSVLLFLSFVFGLAIYLSFL
ncbi:MAG: hypothetical protein AAF922_08785 [Pseudomonadota bacterium]